MGIRDINLRIISIRATIEAIVKVVFTDIQYMVIREQGLRLDFDYN
jgi:hypothetical protein